MRQLFLQHLAQTSPSPISIEIERAEGIYLYAPDGTRYTDLIAGVSVSALGHGHPRVVEAVQRQAARYMHLMVYGEYVQSPQVLLAQRLTALLPSSLSNVYFVNSGSEANEGAIKLAKRHTGRSEVIAFGSAYHGSTQGVLSLMDDEDYKRNFRPLLPDIQHLAFNSIAHLERITARTACVVAEPIQAEAGVIVPQNNFLQALQKRCKQVGALLILDEVQTGMGRTGTFFAFEKYGIVPDILTLAKALGGGMPLGAFVASQAIMNSLLHNPTLGHITTFGGHPVSCAAALAAIQSLIDEGWISQVEQKSQRIKQRIAAHAKVKAVRGEGLLLAVDMGSAERCQTAMQQLLRAGIVVDTFLFCPTAFRIAPPLIITSAQIDEVCDIIGAVMDEL
ncbi:aspartate aminotransferase family protein [Bacteroidia bacterium]|nr:aspartate aminotransferase family protein [Bacteroidia bacterium]